MAPELEARVAHPLQRLAHYWEVVDEWMGDRGFPGCPYINSLVEVRGTNSTVRGEVASYIGDVEAYFGRTAEAAGIPEPAEFGRRMRYIAMSVFVAEIHERSSTTAATARAMTIELLASAFGTTRDEVERAVAAGETPRSIASS